MTCRCDLSEISEHCTTYGNGCCFGLRTALLNLRAEVSTLTACQRRRNPPNGLIWVMHWSNWVDLMSTYQKNLSGTGGRFPTLLSPSKKDISYVSLFGQSFDLLFGPEYQHNVCSQYCVCDNQFVCIANRCHPVHLEQISERSLISR